MANAKVAILDADQAAKDYISDVLELAGYITVSEVGMAGFSRLVETNRVDLVLMCARSASRSTLSRLRNMGNVWRGPIFVLSDADTLSDEVDFLDGGADSWLAMPFRLKELLAMMNSLLRRTQPLEYRIEGILRQDPGVTRRQREVLQFIVRHSFESGYPPTISELQRGFGFKSPNSVITHVRALQSKGYLMKRPRTARGLILNPNLRAASSG